MFVIVIVAHFEPLLAAAAAADAVVALFSSHRFHLSVNCPVKWCNFLVLFFFVSVSADNLSLAPDSMDNNHFRCWTSVEMLFYDANLIISIMYVDIKSVALGAEAQFVRHFALLSNNEHIYMCNISFVSHILLFFILFRWKFSSWCWSSCCSWCFSLVFASFFLFLIFA